MKLPDDIRQELKRRFQSKHREWLVGANSWPMEITLGVPTEQSALRQTKGVHAWVNAWENWQGVGSLSWCERRWKTLGVQRLPEKLILQGSEDVALWIGEATRWQRARFRYQTLIAQWPLLAQQLPKHFDVLADYDEMDFRRIIEMLRWISQNPNSGLYSRQIPVAGVDSKWLEKRTGLISRLMAALLGDTTRDSDFYRCCGLRPLPGLLRIRILDQALRRQTGGLGDISAPYEETANIRIQPTHVFIVENLQTGLAFDDLAGAVVIMGLGYAVDVLSRLPWLQQAQCLYWGDIDTHGFAILNRARSYLPGLKTIFMDEATLMSHRDLWGKEDKQHAATKLPLLTSAEQILYQSLKNNIWGQHVRLEQERIRWDVAWNAIKADIR